MRTPSRLLVAITFSAALLALPALAAAQGHAVPRGGGGGGGRPGGGAPATSHAAPGHPIYGSPGHATNRPPYYPYYPNYGHPYYGYPYYGHGYYGGYPYYGYPYYGYPYYGYPGWGFSLYYGYPYYGFSVGVGYGGYPGYGYGGYAVYPGPAANPYGGVRIAVPQRNAEVYVDGYYAGVVNDFDGTFQQVNLEPGPHRIEVRAAGFEPTNFSVQVTPGHTVTYRAALRQAQP